MFKRLLQYQKHAGDLSCFWQDLEMKKHLVKLEWELLLSPRYGSSGFKQLYEASEQGEVWEQRTSLEEEGTPD